MDEELEEIRKRIDEIDARIVALLEERVAAAKKIGIVKKRKKMPYSDPEREKRVLENVLRRKKTLDAGFMESLYESIIEYCKNEESR